MSIAPASRFLNFLVYSHIFIGICAAFLVLETYTIANLDPKIPLLLFTYSSTATLYSIHRLIQSVIYQAVADHRIVQLWEKRNLIQISAFMHGLLSIFLLIFYLFQQWDLLLIPIALGLLYVTPFKKNLTRLRDLPFVKIFLISICWTWVTFLLPLQSERLQLNESYWWLATERFAFIFAITLPFDIRDLGIDRDKKIKTFAGVLGNKCSRLIAVGFLMIACLSSIMAWKSATYSSVVPAGLLVTYLVALVFILRSKTKSSPAYYAVGMDSTMLIHALLVIISIQF